MYKGNHHMAMLSESDTKTLHLEYNDYDFFMWLYIHINLRYSITYYDYYSDIVRYHSVIYSPLYSSLLCNHVFAQTLGGDLNVQLNCKEIFKMMICDLKRL